MKQQETSFLRRSAEPCFPIHATAKIKLQHSDIPIHAHCCNINRDSLLVCTRLPVAVGEKLAIDIKEGRVEFFNIKGEVVQAKKEQEGYYLLLKL